MTTREYILEQELKKNESLREFLTKHKLECRITQYSYADKLQIFYGHLKCAGLTWEQTEALHQHCDAVIYSDNYNPRVLAQFVSEIEPGWSSKECVDKLDQYLKCPVRFWQDIFQGLSREARVLFVMMAIVPLPVELNVLEQCYDLYLKNRENADEWKSFSDIVIELEKTVIRTDLYYETGGEVVATFQNPSVKDFLIAFLKQNFVQFQSVLEESCIYYAQYVAYLELLNEINASPEVCRKVFEEAIDKIQTDSMSFYDKYKKQLRRNGELKKYLHNFRTNDADQNLDLGRWFQLLILYRDSWGDALGLKVEQYFFGIMIQIAHYPEQMFNENYRILPDVIKTMYRTGICRRNILSVIEVYMDSLMRNRKSIVGLSIKNDFPEVWNQYVEKHREQIAGYLEKYFDAELCVTATEEHQIEFTDCLDMCYECYEEYQMQLPEKLREQIALYDSWITWDENETEEIQEDVKKPEVKTVDEVQQDFEENFLETIHSESVRSVKAWILQKHLSPQVKTELEQLQQEPPGIWWEFIVADFSA